MVLLGLLLVVAAVVWGVTALLGGAGGGAQADTTGNQNPPAATPTDGASTVEPAPSPGQVLPCGAAGMDAELAIDPPEPSAGTAVSFQVTLRNTGPAPCLVDAGPANLVASVSSGQDAVWSSAHCAGDEGRELLLDTGAEHTATVRWAGSRSATGCPGGQPPAGSGTYRVAIELAGERFEPGAGTVFTLG